MVARCEPEHIYPSAVRQCAKLYGRGIVSTANRHDTRAVRTCVRTGFYGRTVPSAEGTLES
eukprot:3707425-Prymnesium_polylepis.2